MNDLFTPMTRKEMNKVHLITREKARFLCEEVHYSEKLPSIGKYYFSDSFFNPKLLSVYGQPVSRGWSANVIELQRLVRMPGHKKILSSFLSSTLRELKKVSDYDFCISYADATEDHHGGIYQATNWVYVDFRPPRFMGYINDEGEFLHCKTLYNRYGTSSTKYFTEKNPSWTKAFSKGKHLYIFPLKKRIKIVLKENNFTEKPYPKPDVIS